MLLLDEGKRVTELEYVCTQDILQCVCACVYACVSVHVGYRLWFNVCTHVRALISMLCTGPRGNHRNSVPESKRKRSLVSLCSAEHGAVQENTWENKQSQRREEEEEGEERQDEEEN